MLSLIGYEQIGWTVLCNEENSHQKSFKGRLYEGKPSELCSLEHLCNLNTEI